MRPHARLFALLLAALALFQAWPAMAHDARPLAVEITEQARGRYLARLRVPPTVERDNLPVLVWPESCRMLGGGEDDFALPAAGGLRQLAECPAALRGQRLEIRWPLYNPALATLFRLEPLDGSAITVLLTPDKASWTVPEQPTPWSVARDYLTLGCEHIWSGIDHLLFVAGLMLLAGTRKRLLLAVTGFTLAHSLTLALSALDLVRVPVAPVEAAIALSILFLAREIALPHPASLARRYPILVASSFGLLHGFGFAAALRETGLPNGELATGLLSFNLGVELGQLVFIALALMIVWLGRWFIARQSGLAAFALHAPARLPGYALGIPAAFWFIQRMVPVLA